MNSVNIVGRVTKDIVLTKTQKNTSKVNFIVAVSRDENNTDFIFCTAYGKKAEILSTYVKKGNKIGISGRIETWSVEKNSRFEYGYTVNCDQIEFLESKPKEQQTQPKQAKHTISESEHYIDISSDDLPF